MPHSKQAPKGNQMTKEPYQWFLLHNRVVELIARSQKRGELTKSKRKIEQEKNPKATDAVVLYFDITFKVTGLKKEIWNTHNRSLVHVLFESKKKLDKFAWVKSSIIRYLAHADSFTCADFSTIKNLQLMANISWIFWNSRYVKLALVNYKWF